MAASAVSADPTTRRTGVSVPHAGSVIWIYALIGLLGALHISMVLGRSINWDEFFFYSQVELVASGEAIQPLQTIHTRFFAWWLPALPGSEIDHIMIARAFMLTCLAWTSMCIFSTAAKLTDKRSAMIAVAAYLGAGFVLQHGTSFRVDPIVTAFLATGLLIAARTRLNMLAIFGFGAVIGLAAMVTVKMVLWVPVFAGIALYRWEDNEFSSTYPLRWVAAGLVALGTFALIYTVHSAGMDRVAAQTSANGMLDNSVQTVFNIADSSRLAFIIKAVLTGLPFFALAAMAPVVILKSSRNTIRKLALFAIWLPILTPLFYRNSFPYFYAFLLPPVAIILAFAVPSVLRRYGHFMVLTTIAASALMVWAVDPRGVTKSQRLLVETVHQTFPDPVAYFDCCGMIAGFDKANDFRTSWGIQSYLAAGHPAMLETMSTRPVPLMIDNKREFDRALTGAKPATFHPEDYEALRDTYTRLWGDIFVAGRELMPGKSMSWNVHVPGAYTVEGDLWIDGREYVDGERIELSRGPSTLTNRGNGVARLMWGDTISAPKTAPPDLYWTAF